MNKKVLIITRDFPPNSPKVGWMIRMGSLANFLAANGVEVHVVCTDRYKSWPELFNLDNDITVHTVKGVSGYWNVPNENASFTGKIIKKFISLLNLILKKIIIDIDQLDVNRYFISASRVIDDQSIKNVLISIPPASLLQVGKKLKIHYEESINIIADYRDAWTLRKIYIVDKDDIQLKKMNSIEQDLLNYIDTTLFVSEGMKKGYTESFTVNNPQVVENGFIESPDGDPDPEVVDLVNKLHKEKKIVLGYFGTGAADGTMIHKDLRVILDYLMVPVNRETAERVSLFVQGQVPIPSCYSTLNIYKYPPVANEKARAHMSLMDVNIMLYTVDYDAYLVMGGKVYDYIVSGRPLWFIIPDNSDSLLSLVEDSGGKILYSDVFNPDSLEKTFNDIIKLWNNNKLNEYGFSRKEASKYSRSSQYSKILDILN